MVIISFIIFLSLEFGHFACFTEEHFKLANQSDRTDIQFLFLGFKSIKLPFVCLVSYNHCYRLHVRLLV